MTATRFPQYDPFGAIENKVQYSFGGDLGLSYNPFTTSQYGQLLLGLAVQNVLQPTVKRAPSEGGTYTIPRNVNTSFFWRGLDRKLEVAGSATLLDISGDGGFVPFRSSHLLRGSLGGA